MRDITTIKSRGAILLAPVFVAGTAFVLFEDVLHGAPITISHVLTALALVGAIGSGTYCLSELRSGHLLSSFGCAVLFLACTGYIVTASGSRNAELAATKSARILADNAERRRIAPQRERAQEALDKARIKQAAECASGKGSRCEGLTVSVSTYAAAVKAHDARLAELGPELTPNAGYKHAGRVFAALPFVEAAAEEISNQLELLMPFVLVLISEIGTMVFGHMAIRSLRGQWRTVEAAPQLLPEPAITTAPEPPRPRSGQSPEPTPPRKPRRKRTALGSNVVVFTKHPVVKALEEAGRPLSNRELARLMSVSDGEASKRWQEVADQLDVCRQGKHLQLSLRRQLKAA